MSGTADDGREIPNLLLSMRRISLGGVPADHEEEWLLEFRKKNPLQFMREFRAAERDFAASASNSGGGTSVPAPLVDEGVERIEELLSKLLREGSA